MAVGVGVGVGVGEGEGVNVSACVRQPRLCGRLTGVVHFMKVWGCGGGGASCCTCQDAASLQLIYRIN